MTVSTCPNCGSDLRFIERTQHATRTNHHNHIYKCSDCGQVVISG